jgi:hypothetical protein
MNEVIFVHVIKKENINHKTKSWKFDQLKIDNNYAIHKVMTISISLFILFIKEKRVYKISNIFLL